MNRFSSKQIAGFIIPSIIGILLFMAPIYVGGQFDIVNGSLTFLPEGTTYLKDGKELVANGS